MIEYDSDSYTKNDYENFEKKEKQKNEWFEAVNSNNITKLKQMIENNMDCNIRSGYGNHGYTALMEAVANGYSKMIKLLIYNNVYNKSGILQLLLAWKQKQRWREKDLIEWIKKFEININAKAYNEETLLYLAIKHNNYYFAKWLLGNYPCIRVEKNELILTLSKRTSFFKSNTSKWLADIGKVMIFSRKTSLSVRGLGLIYSLENHDLYLAKLILSSPYISVNVRGHYGYTALMLSAQNGYEELVKLLIEKGAQVNTKRIKNKKCRSRSYENNIETALSIAVNNRYFSIADLLVEKGAKITFQENLPYFPYNSINKINVLNPSSKELKKISIFDTYIYNKDLVDWVKYSAERGCLSSVKLIYEFISCVDKYTYYYFNPGEIYKLESMIAEYGKSNIVEYIWQKNKLIEPESFIIKLEEEYKNIVKRDQKYKEKITQEGFISLIIKYEAFRKRIIEHAIENKEEETIKLYLDDDIDKKQYLKRDILIPATKYRRLDLVQQSLNLRNNIAGDDSTKNNALIIAAKKGYPEIFQVLLPHTNDTSKNEALKEASHYGHSEIVQILLNHTNHTDDSSKNDAFMVASDKGYTEIVQILLNYINDDTRDKAFRTASSNGHIEIVRILINGRDAKSIDNALIGASFGNHKEVVEFLIENGANVNIRLPNIFHPTLLMKVAEKKYGEIVKILIKNGADLNATNGNGCSAKDYIRIYLK